MTYRKQFPIILALVLLLTPLISVRAAGGVLSGTVTDPKGALVSGATVTVTAPATNQKFTAKTDQQGRYKVEGLPAGVYVVTVSAAGFGDASREGVAITDNQTATLDVRLEVKTVEAGVTISAGGASKGNLDPVYMQLRQKSSSPDSFSGSVASVNNLVLKRDAAIFTLKSGEIYFMSPVEGRTVGAVFIGDGEMSLTPPTDIEKRSLAIFTDGPSLSEQFTQLVLRFTDKTFEEIKQSPNARISTGGAQAARARDLYREKESLLRKTLRTNLDIRTLADLYAAERPGYFTAFIGGRRWNKLLYAVDPLGIADVSPEEVALFSYGESDGGIWAAFHLADEYQKGTATSSQDARIFDIRHHDIEGAIKGTRIIAADMVTFRPMAAGNRVLPFSLFPGLRVKSVQDEQGRDLYFMQENKDEDADFAVIYPEPLEKGKDYKLRVQYEGDGALADTGSGNYMLLTRLTWYPNNAGTQFGDRATFNITFRYPKGNTFIGVGALTGPDAQDGDAKIAKWSSGQTELAVAGFNYGRFNKKELVDKDSGYGIEFYYNNELPSDLKLALMKNENAQARGDASYDPTIGSISTGGMASTILNDTQNALRIYNAYFGKIAYSRLAMSQQPAGNFGQAWPTLIYMPFTAFMDSTQLTQLGGIETGTDTFFKYVGPHEVAHQWWGHMVGWTSYHDQWMSEGFAEFSASLYVQLVRKDIAKFIQFWEDQRKLIIEATPFTKGLKPYTVGPITQGYRLNTNKTGNVARVMIYPKGAYVLHMLRMMMFDPRAGGDAKFREMMTDFIKTHYNTDVSTEDLKRIVEKHMTPVMDIDKNKRMDWFFNQWVYGTEIPAYRLDYSIAGTGGGKAVVNAKITQSGVSKDFAMLVPIYADYGKGWTRLGSAMINGNTSVDLNNLQLPDVPKRLAIAALNDVLATSIENNKK
jgi:Carboxypeptidase regulatory-like domain/Peptidase family M1 domain